jgi:hypothetical protein
VTEGITETNIPSIQLMIGMGIPLWRIACIRATYNKDPSVSVTAAVSYATLESCLPRHRSHSSACMSTSAEWDSPSRRVMPPCLLRTGRGPI